MYIKLDILTSSVSSMAFDVLLSLLMISSTIMSESEGPVMSAYLITESNTIVAFKPVFLSSLSAISYAMLINSLACPLIFANMSLVLLLVPGLLGSPYILPYGEGLSGLNWLVPALSLSLWS